MHNYNDWDYEKQYAQAPVPILAHEIGQWPVYPLWGENEKYKGVLKSRNLSELEQLAKDKGLHHLDKEFRKASGKLSVMLYKDEIESFLRTPSAGGFQLLSMQDYIGQGEALIGWLDSFYDSKGIITAEQFRQFNNEVVPLVKLSSYIWKGGQTIVAPLLLYQFARNNITNSINWSLEDENNGILLEGHIPSTNYERGLVHPVGDINILLPDDLDAQKLMFKVKVEGTEYANSWPIWVFPEETPKTDPTGIYITQQFDEQAQNILESGGSVLLIANKSGSVTNSKYASWKPLYWSASFFPGQNIETLGLLLQDKHPLFSYFPTEGFTDWQWWNLAKDARGFVLNETPSTYQPIAQPISDFHYSDKLGSIFEFKVGEGKLLVCGYDITEENVLPEVAQLRYSILNYMKGDQFNPDLEIASTSLVEMFPYVETAISSAPKEFEDAILYMEVTAKEKGLLAYDHTNLEVKIGTKDMFEIAGASIWQDENGTALVADTMEMSLKVRQGFLGDLYLYYHDWSNQNRRGLITLEGRQYTLDGHDGEGKWIKLHVMREDTQDGEVKLKVVKTSGPNLMFTKIALMAN